MRKLPVLRGASTVANIYNGVEGKGNIIGGYARWMVSPHQDPVPAGDVDVYPNDEDCLHDIEEYIRKYIPLQKTRKGSKMVDSFTTGLSVNFTPVQGPKIQLIKPVNRGHIVAKGTVEEIIDNFDFTVCRAALVSLTEAVVDDTFVEDELKRRLVIKQIHCPIGQIKRIAKYVKKGYYISPAELYKLFSDWDGRNTEYKNELRDALAAWEDSRSTALAGIDGEDFDDLKLVSFTSESPNETLARFLYVD